MGGQFFGDFADEYPTSNTIKNTFRNEGYLLDPHTAVGRTVYTRYKQLMQDDTPTILAATASPFKFPQDVLYAITRERREDAFEAAAEPGAHQRSADSRTAGKAAAGAGALCGCAG